MAPQFEKDAREMADSMKPTAKELADMAREILEADERDAARVAEADGAVQERDGAGKARVAGHGQGDGFEPLLSVKVVGARHGEPAGSLF